MTFPALFRSPASRRFFVLGTAFLLTACGGKEGPTGGVTPPPTTGSLSVTLSGLPPATAGAVNVTGPAGYSRSLGASELLTDLAPGTYAATATQITVGESKYAPQTPSAGVTVVAGSTANLAVAYAIATGAIEVTLPGLPTGATPQISIVGSGETRTITGAATVAGLAPGTYTVRGQPVASGGHTWSAASAEVVVAVSAGLVPAPAALAYQVSTGAITARSTGLPAGSAVQYRVTGPASFSRLISATDTITNLVPGTYTVTGNPVSVGTDLYTGASSATVTVAASITPVVATVAYGLTSGRLIVSFTGLPSGASASATVTGAGGFTRAVTRTDTLTGLAPGTYTVTASNVTSGGGVWGPTPTTGSVQVSTGGTATHAVTYALSRGSLQLVLLGLPQSVPGAIAVSGPSGYSATVTSTTILSGLVPGTYTLSAAPVQAGLHTYRATPVSAEVQVVASLTPASASFTYALASAILNVSITGLPAGVDANVTVTGPEGFSRALTASGLITGLVPGSYTIAAQAAQSGAATYAASPSTQTVSLAASSFAQQATVAYTPAQGNLSITVIGLPAGVNASVLVTGPGGYSAMVVGTQTLQGLLAGLYTSTASSVTSGATTYTATPSNFVSSVSGGSTTGITFTYTASAPPPPPPGMNLLIEGMHVQQVVQTHTGTVPLVSGKGGLLRVFVQASQANSAAPTVRVRFYNGTTLTSTISIPAPSASVPTSVNEGTLSSSWNYAIPSAMMVSGLRILADVDPTGTVSESSETDNTFPASGTPLAMDVRTPPPFGVKFIPVAQTSSGLTGNVTESNAVQFLTSAERLFPLGTVTRSVRATYTTSTPALQDDDGNNAWSQILSEINALRTTDGASEYYAGIVKVGYNSGVAGLGYVPGRATLTWDYLPSANEVFAHELGHNFGRFHAPCGGAGNPDGSYPHAGGLIGAWGYNQTTSALVPNTYADIMGYCDDNWISDYTYSAVLNYRLANPFFGSARVRGSSARPGVLIWGRVERGQVILEPAYDVVAPPRMPSRSGALRLQARGPLGESLLDLSFDGDPVGDSRDPNARHFAWVVPADVFAGRRATEFRLERRGGAPVVQRGFPGQAAGPELLREGPGRVRVTWNDPAIQGVMLRDPQTSEILSFVRRSGTLVVAQDTELDVVASYGAQSSRARVRVGSPRDRLK